MQTRRLLPQGISRWANTIYVCKLLYTNRSLNIKAYGKMASKKGKDSSFFAAARRRRNRNLKIIVPIVVVVAIALVVLSSSGGPALHNNQMVLHNHAILHVISNGLPVTAPAHIGMVQVGKADDPLLYGDHSLDKYGMQGMSPLHTHDDSGTIHVESNSVRNYTLGEFLHIWRGLDVNGKTVQATVNGNPVSDFRNIILNDGEKINLDLKS